MLGEQAREPRDPARRRAVWIAVLALLGGARVFAFVAAFPFFNSIDEHLHLDLVQKYSRGYLPGPEVPHFDAVSARLIVRYASPEYQKGPDAYPDGRIPTPAEVRAKRPPGSRREALAVRGLRQGINIEADAPPLYYAVAGLWLDAGRALGLEGLRLLYWVRWLNPLILAGSVVLLGAFLASRLEDDFSCLAPLALVAAWPNDLLYGITPDVLGLGLGAAGLAALVRLREPRARLALHVGAGLLFGLAFLDKYPGAAFAVVAAAYGVGAIARAPAEARPRALLRWGASGLAAGGLAGWWLVRNLLVLGSLTGQDRKIEWMHWTPRDLAGILAHPLFGWHGWVEFVPSFLGAFWRGEFVWHGSLQHPVVLDPVWVASSLAFLALAAAIALRRWLRARAGGDGTAGAAATRRIEGTSWAILLVSVAILATLSTLFDYGVEEGPLSRAFPYLSSGRLVAGAWPAFAVLYARGIQVAWSWAPPRAARVGRWATLAVVAALALVCELWTAPSVFASPWNWWHLS